MTERVRLAELARMCGVSKPAITQAISRGMLVKDPDGRINISNPKNKDYLSKKLNTLDDRKKRKAEYEKNNPETKVAFNPTVHAGASGDVSNTTKLDIEKIKTLEQIETARLKNEVLRKKYIDRKLIARVFQEIHTVDIQEILPLHITIVADMSALFGITDDSIIHTARQKAKKEIYRALNHRQRIIEEFLKDPWRDDDDVTK